jgi:hypothetical protein
VKFCIAVAVNSLCVAFLKWIVQLLDFREVDRSVTTRAKKCSFWITGQGMMIELLHFAF